MLWKVRLRRLARHPSFVSIQMRRCTLTSSLLPPATRAAAKVMTGRTKLSLKDVAQRAGVSLATVSRVARGQANVDSVIRDRVRKAAEEIGVDLELKHRGSSMVGFILGNRDVMHSFQCADSTGRRTILFVAKCRSRVPFSKVFTSHPIEGTAHSANSYAAFASPGGDPGRH